MPHKFVILLERQNVKATFLYMKSENPNCQYSDMNGQIISSEDDEIVSQFKNVKFKEVMTPSKH